MFFKHFDISTVIPLSVLSGKAARRAGNFRTGTAPRVFAMAAFVILADPAHAQVSVTMPSHSDQPSNVCVAGDGRLVYSGAVSSDPTVCADFGFGSDLSGITVGQPGSGTTLNGDGSAIFNGGVRFNGGTTFAGNVGFTGSFQANQINTGSILNSGSISTSALNTDSFYANSATIAALHVPGAATFDTTVTVGGKLTASQGLVVGAGATIDAGGNRIQNVGAPVADTDAATKAYVDGAVGGLQGNVSSLTTTVADHETRLTTVENVNAQQDTHLNAIDATNTQQDAHLTAIDVTNSRQDNQLAAINAVDSQQSAQISTLQNQVSSLQSDVGGIHTELAGLHQDIRRANAGIAAAVALGGTMVVPDSNVSVSFNLATYRGEQGFSGAVVGRVAPKVYVQVGVSGSTVRGSTAGRVGFSFGL